MNSLPVPTGGTIGSGQTVPRMVYRYVGASATACEKREDDGATRNSAKARADRVSRSDVAGAAVSFIWMCWIFIENDLNTISTAKMSFPQKY